MLLCICLSVFVKARGQEYNDLDETGFFGYTNIYYNPTSLAVTAYTETDLYGSGLYYYEAWAQLSSGGHTGTSQSPNPNTTYTDVYILYQRSSGNTYTAIGTHAAIVAPKYLGLIDDDYLGADQWAAYDIDEYFNFPFTSFSPDTTENGAPIQLGQTFDIAEATISANCGTDDPRNAEIEEYVTYHTPYDPYCSEFTLAGPITYPLGLFNFNSGDYPYFIVRSWMLNPLTAVYNATYFTSIHSAYRNPVAEYTASVNNKAQYHAGSRHQYGDAVDFVTNQSDWGNYYTAGHNNGACIEPVKYQGGSYAHAHLDWRTLSTIGPSYKVCPGGWQ